MIGPRAEDVRCAADKRRFAGPFVRLFGESALAPINPAVQTEKRAMQIIRAARQRFALMPFLA